MKYAIIVNGVVANIALAAEPLATNWVPAGEARMGDSWDGVAFHAPVVPLDELIKARCAEVDAISSAHLSSYRHDFGAPYGVLTLQLRGVEDRANWLTLDSSALGLIMSGQGDAPVLSIRTEENITINVTANQASAVMAGMKTYGGAVLGASWTHKDALRAMADAVQVGAYDISALWPVSA